MIHELIEAQVARTPDAVAVIFEENRLTYGELNRRADGLAHQLRALDVGSGGLVALFVERSIDMVVGMLGVLKAGGAYVPLDPIHPAKRLAYMLADAQPLVLLTQRRLQSELPPHRSHVIVMDAGTPSQIDPAPVSGRGCSPDDLAYVIYTSGSTGEPKGVEIGHRAVVNMLASMQRRPGLGAQDTMLALTTLTFDIAVLEVFLPLMCGARVVIAGHKTISDGMALADFIDKSSATVLQATPSALRMLLDAGWVGAPHLKILCGGEAWTPELANRLLARCGSLWNMYGPTETTVWSAVAKVEAGRPIVIGPPIAHTKFYVLDVALQLVPVGVPGELYIGGAGLARGYRHRPELTCERFVTDPFTEESGTRMYRTGDLVKRLPDGTLEFLGRLDHQVKIRGHRIELGEIEVALERHPSILRCAVVAAEDAHGDQRLVGYVIPAAGSVLPAAELRRLAGETLPAYMIPTAFVSVVSFPLTPSGKLDRKALPPVDVSALAIDSAPVAPRTPTEEVVARIWCEMLNRRQVGVRDNFFELGGHSILAVRVIGRINQILKVHLNVPVFFQNPTIEGLAGALERNSDAQPEPKVVRLQPGHTGLPLYFIGAGLLEHRIARSIGGNRAIFGIDVPVPVEWRRSIAAADRAVLPTIEQMGALYGDVLHAHAGSSPCIVAGYSFFGKVAFEAAHTLQRAGSNVAAVLLLDAFTWKDARPGWRQGLRWIWGGGKANNSPYTNRMSALLSDSWLLLRWQLRQAPSAVKRRTEHADRPSAYFDKDGNLINLTEMHRLSGIVEKSYQPHLLDASGLLIRAKFPDEEILPGHDFTNGWGDLFARGIEIIQTTEDHWSMMGDENLTILGPQINAVLDRYGLG